MHEEFWQARWAQDQIGFHQERVNPYLERHWSSLQLPPGARVLVPLCGKSLDLAWLAGQGYRVLGVELAEKAVLDFFAEQGLAAEVSEGRSRSTVPATWNSAAATSSPWAPRIWPTVARFSTARR